MIGSLPEGLGKTPQFRYVYPNTSEMNGSRRDEYPRGGIQQRLDAARALGCDLVELPADLVKKRSEVIRTGLAIGCFLDRSAIARVYRADSVIANRKLVFHTEPQITSGCRLCWHDGSWLRSFLEMQLALSEHLGVCPAAIEIHPGRRPNTVQDIIGAVRALIGTFGNRYGAPPMILLENRTEHVASDGQSIATLWHAANACGSGISEHFGIVLDIQQLFTQTKKCPAAFLHSLAEIPDEALRGFHVHRRHQAPRVHDGIPWPEVFCRIRKLSRDVLINPEVLARGHVSGALEFCRQMLSDTE